MESAFVRGEFGRGFVCTRLGQGDIGGKASGLVGIRDALETDLDPGAFPGVVVGIPSMVVLTTELFERFVAANHLDELPLDELTDERIALAFQQAALPIEFVGDLRAIVADLKRPIAVRSSSLLEDALGRPFAGVYGTKMLPNHHPDPGERFRRFAEAVKFVWATTWFHEARTYRSAAGLDPSAERMAVVVQEVVGSAHGDRFYPVISGVGRSWNWYPVGGARPEEGVVELALGLGKTIVDGGRVWAFSPAHPATPPPFASARDRVKITQREFWAVNLGRVATYDPVSEVEFLSQGDLGDAEWDGTLDAVVSTYDPNGDRLVPGTGPKGPRVLDFSPLLEYGTVPFVDAVRELLRLGEATLGSAVEIEFAAEPQPDGTLRLAFLQIRAMPSVGEGAEVTDAEMAAPEALVVSDEVLGHGEIRGLADVVLVKPAAYDPARTREIARELCPMDAKLRAAGRPYVLIGFGRWGTSEPWLGVPVTWADIAGARAIIEAGLPGIVVDPSQGSHFFHNLTSFGVPYFFVREGLGPAIDWARLDALPAVEETGFLRWVRVPGGLEVRVDGRAGRGVVRTAGGEDSGEDVT